MCSATTFIGKLKSSSSPANHTKLVHAAWRRGAACRRPEHLGYSMKGQYSRLKRCRSLIGWLTFSKGMGHSNVAILVSMCFNVLLVELPRCFAGDCPPARQLPVRWGAEHYGLAAQGHTRGAMRLMLIGKLPAHVLACCWACSSFRNPSPGVRHLACRLQLTHQNQHRAAALPHPQPDPEDQTPVALKVLSGCPMVEQSCKLDVV